MTLAGRRTGLSNAWAWVIVAGVLGVAAAFAENLSWRMATLAPPPQAQGSDAPMILVERPPEASPPPTETHTDAQGRAVRAPAWAVRPTGVYPQAAARAGVSQGEATLICEALADGRLGACRIVRETPEGYGFAAAAEAGARQARLHPHQIDGFSTDSSVTFTTRFRVE